MELRLLGPLQVREGGRVIALGGPRQAAVLAMLALTANQVVSKDRLVLGIWGDCVPPTAANSLQAAVSRLRKVLPSGHLLTTGPGYMLRVSASELDVLTFERLASEGREALADGSLADAARLLGQALALWRGPPLADFTYEPFAQADISRLEDQRISCLENRIEADLGRGSHAEAIGELTALVLHHPLRERLRGLLMLALYRTGREPEALAIFTAYRALLRDELGQEPTAHLRDLHTAILRHEPGLDVDSLRPPLVTADSVRKPITVVCGLIGMTSPSQSELDPEAMWATAARVAAVFGSAAGRHGGYVVHDAGDRLLAAFGVPTVHEDDSVRAARAALEVRDTLGLDDDATGLRVEIRLGVASGEALVTGAEDTAVSGEPVSRAARLAELAGNGEIVVAGETQLLLAGAAEVEQDVDGLGRLVSTALGTRRPTYGVDGPFFGRDAELRRIHDMFGMACRQLLTAQVVVVGEAGAGKTRLARAAAERLAGQATIVTGRCVQYGQPTLWPLPQVLHEIIGEDIGVGLAGILDGDPDGVLVAATLAAVDRPRSESAVSPPDVFWAVRRLLEAVARRRPVVLVLDDLHWAEPVFLDLVESVHAQAKGPILLLCLARSPLTEHRPQWADHGIRTITLDVGPLDDRSAGSLLDAAAKRRLDRTTRNRLLARAAGNPMFIEQLAAHARDHAVAGDDPIPPTIQRVLHARMELLAADERSVLERAAVLGHEFSLPALRNLMPAGLRPSVERHLDALTDQGLMAPYPRGGASRLQFRHELVQQSAYRRLTKSARAELHLGAADWLEDSGTGDRQVEILSHHLEQVIRYRQELGQVTDEVRSRAARSLTLAGTRAHAAGDASAAIGLLERAITQTRREGPDAVASFLALSAALVVAGRLEAAERTLDEASSIATTIGDERLRARADVRRILLHLHLSTAEVMVSGRGILPNLQEVFDRHGDHCGLSQAAHASALMSWIDARAAGAERAWEVSAHHARVAGDDGQLVECLGWLASVLLWGPEPAATGVARCRRYLAEVGNHRSGQPVILNHLAGLVAMQGRVEEAESLLVRARSMLDDLGITMTSAVAHPAAYVAMMSGRYDAAEHRLQADYESLSRMGEQAYLSTTGALLARALALQGKQAEAQEFALASLEAAAPEDLSCQVIARSVLARCAVERSRAADAVNLAAEAVELAAATDLLSLHGDALLDQAHVRQATGDHVGAAAAADGAARLFRRKGNLLSLAVAQERLRTLGTSALPRPQRSWL